MAESETITRNAKSNLAFTLMNLPVEKRIRMAQFYAFCRLVDDIVDEPGSISTLSVILAAKGISIKNIGINNNRELGEGALKISFYDKDSMEAARRQLEKYKYELSPL